MHLANLFGLFEHLWPVLIVSGFLPHATLYEATWHLDAEAADLFAEVNLC